MKPLFPRPLLSLTLLLSWLLLVQSVAPGQLVLGALLAVGLPRLCAPFWPGRSRVARPLKLAGFLLMVLYDIVVANLQVAKLILGSPARLQPRFVEVPVALADEFVLALLANTVTMTPGTVSCDLGADRRTLLVHALHCTDPAALADAIKRRYEAPLKEIFAC